MKTGLRSHASVAGIVAACQITVAMAFGEDLIQMNLGWDPASDSVITNTDIPSRASENMNALVHIEKDFTLDHDAGVRLHTLYTQEALRVLHLVTHGTEDGWIMFDAFDDGGYAQAAYDALKAEGFTADEIRVDQVPLGQVAPYVVSLAPAGVLSKFRAGRFLDEGLVLGWYSYSADNPDWLGDEVTTMVGKTSADPTGSGYYNFYAAAGCNTPTVMNDTITLDGKMSSCRKYARLCAANGGESDPNIVVLGDGANSLAPPLDRKWENSCLIGQPWVVVESFLVAGGRASWEVRGELNTLAYRISGAERRDAVVWTVLTSEIEAHGGAGTYECSVPEHHRWYALEEKEMTAVGPRWRKVDFAGARGERGSGASARAVRDTRRVSARGEETGGRAVVSTEQPHVARVRPGADGEAAKRMEGESPGGVLIVLPCNSDSLPDDVALRIGEEYRDALVEYGGFDSGDVAIYEPVDCYHQDDSLETATRILEGDEQYVLIFGDVMRKNLTDPGTTVLPWIYDPSFEEVWGDTIALSLADWEVHSEDGRIAKSIGLIPVRDSLDMWAYYDKMVAYYINGPSGYEHALGIWGWDNDNFTTVLIPGAIVRNGVMAEVERIHPSWDVRRLLLTEMPNGTMYEYWDSTKAALAEGRAQVVALGTGSSALWPANAFHWNDEELYDTLAYSGRYAQLLLLSCWTHAVDGDDPYHHSAVERMIQLPGGGAITSIGPTRGYYQWYYFRYLSHYLEQLEKAAGPVRVGDLHRAARRAIVEEDTTITARMFSKIAILLGDPTIPVYGMYADPVTDVRSVEEGGSKATLGAARPSPFNPNTRIPFSISSAGPVRMAIYDVSGRLVRVLVDGDLAGGAHEVTWDGSGEGGREAASGVYFCQLKAGGMTETARMMLVR